MATTVIVTFLLAVLCQLFHPSNSHPFDLAQLLDPIQQAEQDGDLETKFVVPKSVFNVPVRTEAPVPRCPEGTQRVTADGECLPKAITISYGDKFLFDSIRNFYRTKPTSPSPHTSVPHRRRRPTTTKRYSSTTPRGEDPSYMIHDEDNKSLSPSPDHSPPDITPPSATSTDMAKPTVRYDEHNSTSTTPTILDTITAATSKPDSPVIGTSIPEGTPKENATEVSTLNSSTAEPNISEKNVTEEHILEKPETEQKIIETLPPENKTLEISATEQDKFENSSAEEHTDIPEKRVTEQYILESSATDQNFLENLMTEQYNFTSSATEQVVSTNPATDLPVKEKLNPRIDRATETQRVVPIITQKVISSSTPATIELPKNTNIDPSPRNHATNFPDLDVKSNATLTNSTEPTDESTTLLSSEIYTTETDVTEVPYPNPSPSNSSSIIFPNATPTPAETIIKFPE